ncbi:hypothetical protein F9K50_12180 [bacterium]|nr:MAG: hypothetical protein F9K50_12180 [bacterium]
MLFRPRALPVLLCLFSSLLLVSILVSCSNKKGAGPGEDAAFLPSVVENGKTNLSNVITDGGLAGGGGDTEAGPEGAGLKDGDKDEEKKDEDDAAFRMIVD